MAANELASSIATAGGVTAQKGGYFMAIAAASHGAPAAAVRAGIVVEEEAADGVGTATDGRKRAFDEKFCGGASKGSEEPVQAALTSDELQRPGSFAGHQFVVTFGDSQDLINRFSPGSRERLLVDDAAEYRAQRLAKAEDTEENGVHGLRFTGEQGSQTGGAIPGDKARVKKEGYE